MSLNATEINQVVSSLNRTLQNARIREVISEAEPGQITLIVRHEGENHYLRFVLTAQWTRLGRIQQKPKATSTPHPFVMLLRRELLGSRIERFTQINDDRIVAVRCVRHHQMPRTLIAELTAHYANLFFTDSKGNVRGSFWSNRSSKRDLGAGTPYVPPPPPVRNTPSSRFCPDHTIEAQIDAYYQARHTSHKDIENRVLVARMLQTVKKKNARLIANLEKDLAHAESGDTLLRNGHLLKMHLTRIKKGDTAFEATDFDQKRVVIPLNPRYSPVANMEKMFEKAKRLKRAVSQIEERLLLAMSESEHFDEMASSMHDASAVQIEQLKARLIRRYPQLKRIASKALALERLPYRLYYISSNRPAKVGRSAKDNDALTLHHSSPDDLWLHVRGETGSHVVVPMGRKEDPSPELLVDAAHLAAHFSKLKDAADVEVIYTRRRYVQKPKGSSPGAIRLLREKTIFLKIEPDRLKRILSSAKASTPHPA